MNDRFILSNIMLIFSISNNALWKSNMKKYIIINYFVVDYLNFIYEWKLFWGILIDFLKIHSGTNVSSYARGHFAPFFDYFQ